MHVVRLREIFDKDIFVGSLTRKIVTLIRPKEVVLFEYFPALWDGRILSCDKILIIEDQV